MLHDPGLTIAENNLLAALNPDDLALLQPHLHPVKLRVGDVLYRAGDNVRYAYLPTAGALASFTVHTGEGVAVETAMVGREGAVGGIVSQGHLPAFARSCVMHGGVFLKIDCERLQGAKDRSAQVANLFTRYADCLVAQIFQSVACNAVHRIDQRAARWLLGARDRTGTDEFVMTQEQLSAVLGVGRSYVSRVVGRLKEAGIITTRRGAIRIADAARLEGISCDCSTYVKDHFDTVLAGIYPEVD